MISLIGIPQERGSFREVICQGVGEGIDNLGRGEMSPPVFVCFSQAELHPVNRFGTQEDRLDGSLKTLEISTRCDVLLQEREILIFLGFRRNPPDDSSELLGHSPLENLVRGNALDLGEVPEFPILLPLL